MFSRGMRPSGEVHRPDTSASRRRPATTHAHSAASRSTSRPARTRCPTETRCRNREALQPDTQPARARSSRAPTPDPCACKAAFLLFPCYKGESDSRLPMRSLLQPPATPGPANTPLKGSLHARPVAAPKPVGVSDPKSRRTRQSEAPRWGSSCSRRHAYRRRGSRSSTATSNAPRPAPLTNRSSSER